MVYMEQFVIEGCKELVTRGGEKILSFNLMYHPDFEADSLNYFATIGFRLMSGSIHPPAGRTKAGYNPVNYFGETFSRSIYKALKEVLDAGSLHETFLINQEKTAILPLVNRVAISRFFPSTTGYI